MFYKEVLLKILKKFVSNNKLIYTNWLTSIPPEIIKNHIVFRWFQGYLEVN